MQDSPGKYQRRQRTYTLPSRLVHTEVGVSKSPYKRLVLMAATVPDIGEVNRTPLVQALSPFPVDSRRLQRIPSLEFIWGRIERGRAPESG